METTLGRPTPWPSLEPRRLCTATLFLQQPVAPRPDTLLNGLDDGTLLKHRALPVTLGLVLQPVAYIGDVHQPLLVEIVVDDVIPRRTSRVEPLPVLARNDPVAGRLVPVLGQEPGVEIGRVVLQGFRRVRAVAERATVVQRGRCLQNLNLRAYLLQVALQLFVFGRGLLLCSFRGSELRLELFDVSFLPFSKSTLTVRDGSLACVLGSRNGYWRGRRIARCWVARMTRQVGRCFYYSVLLPRQDLRCTILGLPP